MPSQHLIALLIRLHTACPNVDIGQVLRDCGSTYSDSGHFERSLEPMVISLEALSDTSDLSEWMLLISVRASARVRHCTKIVAPWVGSFLLDSVVVHAVTLSDMHQSMRKP